MNYYVANTDIDWYRFLRERKPEEMNFWQPSDNREFHAVSKGAPFLLRLKSPVKKVAGMAFYSAFSFLPLSMAWQNFGELNGCRDQDELRGKINGYRRDQSERNPRIGCLILSDPIFFNEADWLDVPEWHNSIVSGKTYSMDSAPGIVFWEKIRMLLEKYNFFDRKIDPATNMVESLEENSRYGSEYLTRARLGQGAFRITVMDAYNRKCSISGEKTLPVLQAGHIKPFSMSGPNKIKNGILLRSDIHRLFDDGYITITQELKVEVSNNIRREFENGREYYKFHGQNLVTLPDDQENRPNAEFLNWHNENIYKG